MHLIQQTIRKNRRFAIFAALAFTHTFALTGCSSAAHKRELLIHTISKQNELITALKNERAATEIKRKVEQDATLHRSEVHLISALDEISESNEQIQKSIQE